MRFDFIPTFIISQPNFIFQTQIHTQNIYFTQ